MKNNTRVLLYHSIGAAGNGEVGSQLYSVSIEDFKQQMAYISKRSNNSKGFLSSVAVTFDDGDVTNFTNAYPVLNEFGIRAYFFIIVSKVGTTGYMNWKQIKQLKDGGMIVGSHGFTHKNIAGLSDEELNQELLGSKKVLEENFNERVDYFAVPFGLYDKKVIEKAKEAGYKRVFTSKFTDNDSFKLGRIAVRKNWDFNYFVKVINSGLSVADRSRELIKHASRKILGADNYNRIRKAILKEQKRNKLVEATGK